MLIFNCTKAAQDFFTVTRKGKKQTIVEVPPCKDMSEDIQHLSGPTQIQQWMLHAVSIKRKHCLIAVEVNTRFSVIVTGVKKADLDEYLQLFKTYLSSQVLEYGREHDVWDMSDAKSIVSSTLDHLAEAHFFRRYNANVQARINTIVQNLRYWVEEDPMLLTDENMLLNFNAHHNQSLCKSKAHKDKGYIIPFQEMVLVWQQLYQNASLEQVASTRQFLKDHEKSRMEALLDSLTGGMHSSDMDEPLFTSDEPEMIMPENKPLTREDVDFLYQTLLKYKTELSPENISSLHGFLTAIVSGPNMLVPSRWMPAMWGGEEEQPAWEDMDEAQHFMGALFGMMNEISDTLMNAPQSFSAIFMGDEHFTDVSDWCFGYMDGVGLDDEAWDELPSHLSGKLEFLDENAAKLFVDNFLSPNEQAALKDEVVGIAQALHAYWLQQRSPQQPSFRDRPNNVVPIRPQLPVTSQKIGRNDPCPCGSGKKFKKCCLN